MVALPKQRVIPPDHAHPFDPLTRSEILATVSAVRQHIADGAESVKPIQKILFNSIGLAEPDKYAVLKWAGTFSEKEIRAAGAVVGELTRQAEVHLIDPISGQSFEAVVDLPSNLPDQPEVEAGVRQWKAIAGLLQPSLQPEELLWAEDVCKGDAKVRAACEAEGIDPDSICVDGWCVGTDERFPGRRLQQCFVFFRLRPDDNLYAHPCDFVPVIDSHTGEVLSIDYPPTNAAPGDPAPPSSAEAYEASEKRAPFAAPKAPHNYLPEQIAMDDPTFKLRDTLKPIHVTQPEGVSYTMKGRVLEWEKFKVHVGFSYREGLVLSNITYNDGAKGERPLFYRLSVAEMVVPYGKATFPHQRKHAFDTGEYGIGALANSLALGCDCLGSITYLDADFCTRAGGVETIKSAICIHEEDGGILHKHTDFRDNRVHVARNRKLVISSICTVANYEYAFYFNFALDGSIELEVKATGIVNAYTLKEGEPTDMAHEVYVAPRIAAHHHQHLFSYRIDPMIDGLQNSVVQVDVEADEAPVGSKENYYGNGFVTKKQVFETAKGAVSDYDASKCRSWVIENPNKKHYCTGGNVGYKIMSKDMPPLLAKPGSLVWNRAPFARHNMFVTQYKADELFPSEVHINQNPGGEDFGLQKWVNRDENVKNTDIVAWPCFGVTHISRPEDWPIMPVEILRVHLKPSAFFDRNPGLDVPGKADVKSRLATEAFSELSLNGATNGVNGLSNTVNGVNGVNGRANGDAHAPRANGGGCCNGR